MCNLSLRCIDRNKDVDFRPQFLDTWKSTAQFFFCCDRFRAGPRRFAAYIDDLGAFPSHAQAALDRLFGSKKSLAVGERIRRDVQDAHDQPVTGKIKNETGDFPLPPTLCG